MESCQGHGTAADKIPCVCIFNEKSFVHALDFEDAYLGKGGFDGFRGSTQVFLACSVKCSFAPQSLFGVHGRNTFIQLVLILSSASHWLPLLEQIGDLSICAKLKCEIVSES